MVKRLLAAGHHPVVLDDLSCGHRDAVLGGKFVEGNSGDRRLLNELFPEHRFDAVMHFASFIQVGESIQSPAKYYRNNAVNSLALLDAMVEHGVNRFIFSSTAAVFGDPDCVPIDEAHATRPINPYGWSKLMVEQILQDYDRAYGLESVSLRYFNAAGADPEGRLGERHAPETHLIPLVLQAAAGRRRGVSIFGTDYETPDGTCLRDYIHVSDLCDAHLLALDYLLDGGTTGTFNLGNGAGFSVQEVIETAGKVTGREIPVTYAGRRPGDPARLVADSTRAKAILQWRPRYSDIATIVEHAWQWEKRRGHP